MSAKIHAIASHFFSYSLCVFAVIYYFIGYADEVAVENSNAIGYRCTMGDMIRRVEINYPQSPETLPCEVIYYKDTESPNIPEVLWSADSNASYCETQADAMVYRLTTEWGWQCEPK